MSPVRQRALHGKGVLTLPAESSSRVEGDVSIDCSILIA